MRKVWETVRIFISQLSYTLRAHHSSHRLSGGKHCCGSCVKSIPNRIRLQKNKNCHPHNLPSNCNAEMLILRQSRALLLQGSVSLSGLVWASPKEGYVPHTMTIVIFTKMDSNSEFFSCVPIKNSILIFTPLNTPPPHLH